MSERGKATLRHSLIQFFFFLAGLPVDKLNKKYKTRSQYWTKLVSCISNSAYFNCRLNEKCILDLKPKEIKLKTKQTKKKNTHVFLREKY